MALFDKLNTDGTLSMRGLPGPTFENEGQRATSDIQAYVQGNNLAGSQDMSSGRTYGNSPSRIRVEPSDLDMGGVTPDQYVNRVGANPTSPTYTSATGVRSTILGKLPLSRYGLAGLPGPSFENEAQRATSNIQAQASGNNLQSSQDLRSGRRYGTGRFTVFVQPSNINTNGIPSYPSIGGPYKNNGPKEGRY
jgi:hypothetical protein